MVNITNDEIKLLKKLMDLHFNHQYDLKTHFECQTMLANLEGKMRKKTDLNREQYQDRLFWKEYENKKNEINL